MAANQVLRNTLVVFKKKSNTIVELPRKGNCNFLAKFSHIIHLIHQIWFNDTLLKSTQAHNGAVFSACKKGRWIFTGGWDKTVSVQVNSLNIKNIRC